MDKDVKNLVGKIEKYSMEQLKKKKEVALRKTAQIIGEEIQDLYKNCVQKFYRHYSPKYYDRTYSTFAASSGYGLKGKVFKKISEDFYVAGITVDPSIIKGDPYYTGSANSVDKQFVFDRTFYEGIHGFTKRESEKYGWENITHIPSQMHPSPYKIMRSEFDSKINTQEHVNDVFSSVYGGTKLYVYKGREFWR